MIGKDGAYFMKKLKIPALLMTVAAVLAMFSGCTEQKLAYTALGLDTVSDGITGKIYTSEVSEWSFEKRNSHKDASAPAEATVTFNGVTYTGSYETSFVWMPNAFVSHAYEQKLEDGVSVTFRINSKTGKLTFISIYHMNQEQTTPVEEAQCRKTADAIADDYISLKDYKVNVDIGRGGGYSYTYYREVNGYATTDMMRVYVRENGEFGSCDIAMVGTFKDVKKLEIDEEKAATAIEEKLQLLYGEVEYTVVNKEWVKTPDGQCGRLYRLKVRQKDDHPEGGFLTDLLLV